MNIEAIFESVLKRLIAISEAVEETEISVSDDVKADPEKAKIGRLAVVQKNYDDAVRSSATANSILTRAQNSSRLAIQSYNIAKTPDDRAKASKSREAAARELRSAEMMVVNAKENLSKVTRNLRDEKSDRKI